MKFRIERCFDSHVHLLPTGEYHSVPQLSALRELQEWQRSLLEMPLRRGWRMGFGWDPESFPELASLNADDLERISPGVPLIVSRRDGHSACLNQTALKSLSWDLLENLPESLRPFVKSQDQKMLDGQVFEEAYFHVLKILPVVGAEERREYLRQAQSLFLAEGFTHLREMMGDQALLEALTGLDQDPDWHLRTEVFLHHAPGGESRVEDVLVSLRDFNLQKLRKSRAVGIKFFLDGALGSETAFLSYPYEGHSHHGESLWPVADLKRDMREVWKAGFRVAVHCIGDASLQQVLEVSQSLAREGVGGGLSIEHAELIRPDSYEFMEDLDLEFHFQPSHFLSDQKWLRQKLGERWAWCFPWKKIEEIGYPIFFGSDSPIEVPSLRRTREGLEESARQGIPRCEIDWRFAHSHPNAAWGKNTWTEITEAGVVLRVVVDGQEVFKAPHE